MERHKAGNACVIPIILCTCDWQNDPDLRKLQALPKDAKPVTSWQDQNEAFLDVTESIRKVIRGLALDAHPLENSPQVPATVQQTKTDELTAKPVVKPGPMKKQSKLAYIILIAVIICSLIVGLLKIRPFSLGPVCGGAFSDQFEGSLHSGWSWINPSDNATYDLAAQGLHILAPPNSDINPVYNNFNAPRLLQPINGNFTVETQVQFSPNVFFQSAGILIWQDPSNFLRFERGYNTYGIVFEKDSNTQYRYIPQLNHDPVTAALVELRVQRSGDHFTVSWREPGKAWQIVGGTDIHFDNPKAGLDLVATFKAPQTTASYRYFNVSCD